MKFRIFELLNLFEKYWDKVEYNLSRSDMKSYVLKDLGGKLRNINLGEAYTTGNPKLKEVLSKEYDVEESRILVTSGASEANFLVCAALLEKGDEVIVENPTYPPLRNLPRGFGVRTKLLQRKYEDGFKVRASSLTPYLNKRTKLAVFSNLNNPTGIAIPKDEMKEVRDMAEDKGFYVLWDEIFREGAFEKAPPSASSFGDRMLVTSSLSKFYGLGGLRIGWLFASEDILAKVKRIKDYTTVACSRLSEEVAKWAIGRKEFFQRRARKILLANRRTVEDWIENNDFVNWVPPDGGNICFPKVDVDVKKLSTILIEKYRTLIAPGELFGMKGHFRLGFGGDGEELRKGLENLGRALQEISG